MILYNTTFHLDKNIENELLVWIKQSFSKKALECGFVRTELARIRLPQEDDENVAFALHLYAEQDRVIDRWSEEYLNGLLKNMYEKWGDRALTFSTSMDLIDLL